MDRIQGESFRFDCPLFAAELVRREAFEGLQSSPEVVGADEVAEVLVQLVVLVVMEAFDGRVPDRAVHAFNLAAPRENRPPGCFLILAVPRVFGLGQPVFDVMLVADAVEDVLEGVYVPVVVVELDAAAIGLEPMAHR